MSDPTARARRWPRRLGLATAVLLGTLGALLVPDPDPEVEATAGRRPFVWDEDARWAALEARFAAVRAGGCAAVRPEVDAGFASLDAGLDTLSATPRPPGHPDFEAVEASLFTLGPLVGACPARTTDFVERFARLRSIVKDQSLPWDASSQAARDQVYRLLYGGRMAVEELLLQLPEGSAEALTPGTDEPSQTPSTELLGVRVHSGDMLVSRGGAPTSAFIARGNDYPGNFSHVALLHVDDSGGASIIESHIEEGVVVSSMDDYLEDKKLRVMVLRLRADLPELRADPGLPHRAATDALEQARERHIPYDFEMDYGDHRTQFCSEVASAAYEPQGVRLWEGLTSMSSSGVTRWLAAFGVRQFETHGPSDLEYDPKVRVVAEWRDPETLYQDHVDNAVLDAMLEGAEQGDELAHDWRMLPLARLAKGWSVILNLFGGVGPVPEGMSATVALRAEALGERHGTIKAQTLRAAAALAAERGYRPPYWELVRLAREASRAR